MCGLVGFITSYKNGFNANHVKAFEEMLYVDTLRGEDATGICYVSRYQGATVLKKAVESTWFMYDSEYYNLSKEFTAKGKALLGHNRKATIGGRVDKNAHPFTFDDRYVFFHNGTLHNHKSIADTEVDSEALGGLLTKCDGDKEKLEEALGKVNGAYATVWYDAEKDTVYFLRNKERPLCYAFTAEGHFMYASEAWMIVAGASRNNLKVEKIEVLPVDTLVSIDLSATTLAIKETKLEKKAPRASTFHGRGPATTSRAAISKREIKGYIDDLKKASVIAFFVDDLVCAGIPVSANPDPEQCYDWMFFGSNPEMEGVVFKFLVKNLFPHEAEGLLDGRMITGNYKSHVKEDGELVVWIQNAYWRETNVCH